MDYLARQAELRGALTAMGDESRAGVSAERALEWVTVLAETWQRADVPAAKAEPLHAIYERIVVEGRRITSVHLTLAAYEHGLALALPEEIQCVMASPPVLSAWEWRARLMADRHTCEHRSGGRAEAARTAAQAVAQAGRAMTWASAAALRAPRARSRPDLERAAAVSR